MTASSLCSSGEALRIWCGKQPCWRDRSVEQSTSAGVERNPKADFADYHDRL